MIEEVLTAARKVLTELEKAPGYQLQALLRKRIEYFERNKESESRLARTKFWRRELDYLLGMASDMKGLRDYCPEHLEYPQWVALLASLRESIERYGSRLANESSG